MTLPTLATTAPATPLLDVRELTVALPAQGRWATALDRVSLTVGHGEVVGLVGESGAGKSMLGAAVSGLLPTGARLTGGGIWLNGLPLHEQRPAALRRLRGRRIGVVFQDPLTSLDPLFTIGDQLMETIRAHLPLTTAQARARALDLLNEVGLDRPGERFNQYPHQFSGGMRQRIVIALALCADPELLIADEPTTALDVSLQAQILALLRGLVARRGMGVLLVTHDMGVVHDMADRVAVLYAGRLAEVNHTAALMARPRHPYTAGLLAAIPQLDPALAPAANGGRVVRLAQIPGAMPRLGQAGPGCAFEARCTARQALCHHQAPPAGQDGAALWHCHFPQGTHHVRAAR